MAPDDNGVSDVLRSNVSNVLRSNVSDVLRSNVGYVSWPDQQNKCPAEAAGIYHTCMSEISSAL